MTDFWNGEGRVDQLKTLWVEGLSATQIALVMGAPSRNSILSKIHRMHLSNTRPASVHKSHERKPRQSRRLEYGSLAPSMPPEVVIEEPPVVLADGSHVTVLTCSDRTCRWPIGDPLEESFCFCGHKPREGSPYCEAHARKAFQPQQMRRAA